VPEGVQLVQRLHALGDDVQPELVRHPDDRRDDRRVGRLGAERCDERPVDLQLVHAQRPQPRQRAVAGAEVVDRQARAGPQQLGEHPSSVERSVSAVSVSSNRRPSIGTPCVSRAALTVAGSPPSASCRGDRLTATTGIAVCCRLQRRTAGTPRR
jgi:hypothetical protein